MSGSGRITVVDRPYLFHADVFFEDVDGVGLTVHEDVRDQGDHSDDHVGKMQSEDTVGLR